MGSCNSVIKTPHRITVTNELDVTRSDQDEETAIPGKVLIFQSVIKLRRISSRKDIIDLEKYFLHFRRNIVGINEVFVTPYGTQKLVYCDWTASARSVNGKILDDLLSSLLYHNTFLSCLFIAQVAFISGEFFIERFWSLRWKYSYQNVHLW